MDDYYESEQEYILRRWRNLILTILEISKEKSFRKILKKKRKEMKIGWDK